MEQDILNKLVEQEAKIDKIQKSVEQMRRYFLWTLIISVALIVLPLIGLVFLVPQYMMGMLTSFGAGGF